AAFPPLDYLTPRSQAALLAGEPVLRGATSAPASLSPATWLPLGRSGPTPGAPRVVRTAGFRPGAAVAAAAGGRGASRGGDRVSSGAAQQQVLLASVSQSTSAPPPVRPSQPSSYPGTPLMWVGVGVALSLFASWGSKFVMQRMQQAMMKQMLNAMQSGGGPGGAANPFAAAGMGGGANPFAAMGGGDNPFAAMGGGGAANPFGGMPFPPPASPSSSSPSSASSGSSKAKPSSTAAKASAAVVDVAAKVADAKPAAAAAAAPSTTTSTSSTTSSSSSSSSPASAEEEAESSSSKKKSFFQDAEVVEELSGGGFSWGNTGSSAGSSGGNASNATWDTSTNSFANGGAGGAKGKMTVEALEKMLEDPMVQKMVFPYLPEEMRDPATFKWMMQSPMYRQQLESMLDNMGGTGFDDRVLDMMKSFDLNSPEVKDQFSQLGMSPEDVVGKIMSNPKLAAAFQNPRLQAAILDVSSNPVNWTKYQNDAEVMEIFNQIQELFAPR
ncbi:unnamed protein product, partial [Closterium sp. Naga37s-1]